MRIVYRPFLNDRSIADNVIFGLTENSASTVLEAEEAFFGDAASLQQAAGGLSGISAPTLVVCADSDPTPEAFARSLASQIPGTQFALLTGASHFAPIENPTAFFASVTPFLERAAAAS